eukprot:TRINITY_DN251_c1_g1_i1.p1 TRINITY_DN251_c1_g1~~TRINITY_DN251_c1_g1_i1.p1  ORF type:complete len:2058 (+),score=544.59 TRINITY_DN251_c1_g1_i1:93-6266(+)
MNDGLAESLPELDLLGRSSSPSSSTSTRKTLSALFPTTGTAAAVTPPPGSVFTPVTPGMRVRGDKNKFMPSFANGACTSERDAQANPSLISRIHDYSDSPSLLTACGSFADASEEPALDRYELAYPFSAHLKLMLAHELRLKRRKPCASLCELLTPTLCVVLLVIASNWSPTHAHSQHRFDDQDALNVTQLYADLEKVACARWPQESGLDEAGHRELMREHQVPIEFSMCPEGVSICHEVAPTMELCVFPGYELDAMAAFFALKHQAESSGVAGEGDAQLVEYILRKYILGQTRPVVWMDLDDFARLRWIGTLFADLAPPGETKAAIRKRIDWILADGALEFALGVGADASTHCPLVQSMIAELSHTYRTFDWMYNKTLDRGSSCEGVWDTPDAAIRHAKAASRAGYEGEPVWALVVLERTTNAAAKQLDVVLRMDVVASPYTDRLQEEDKVQGLGARLYQAYHYSGHAAVQTAVTQGFMNVAGAGADGADTAVWNTPRQQLQVPMPIKAYVQATFYGDFLHLVPLTLSFFFAPGVAVVCTALVREKETRQREALFVMGMNRAAFFVGKFAVYGGMNAVTAAGMTAASAYLFPHASSLLVFLLYYLYALAHSALAVLVATFFSKARVAGFVSPLLALALAFPAFIVGPKLPLTARHLLFWLPAMAFSPAMEHVMLREIGARPTSLADLQSGPYSIGTSLGYLLLDVVLYVLFSQYCEEVLPSEWGVKRHPLFCLPGWCRGFRQGGAPVPDGRATAPPVAAETYDAGTAAAMEGRAAVKITHLTKTFSGKDAPAVDGLGTGLADGTLRFYEGQIQVVLGHNGAGKTSLINLLTGLLPPTSGDCTIFGHSIRDGMKAIRQDIGLCPQHNILWDDMTCTEHVRFYAGLKGVPKKDGILDARVAAMLRLVKLDGKEHARAGSLSGGQKRKLSVAIAFVGAPRFVVMDEPTAGMDVEARRAMWKLLRTPLLLENRCVMLTTHFMDEADLLGDSVAIMEAGRLHSVGSPSFLKQKFGAGYNLSATLVKGARFRDVLNLVQEHLPTARKLSSGGNELRLQLPSHHALPDGCVRGSGCSEALTEQLLEAGNRAELAMALIKHPRTGRGDKRALKKLMDGARVDGDLPRLFKAVDARPDLVKTYGISVTTLEEIFMQIAGSEPAATPTPASPVTAGSPVKAASFKDAFLETEEPLRLYSLTDAGDTAASPPLTGRQLFWTQFRVLLGKRASVARRDRSTCVLQFVLPVLFVVGAVALGSVAYPEPPPLHFDQHQYDAMVRQEGVDGVHVQVAAMSGSQHPLWSACREAVGTSFTARCPLASEGYLVNYIDGTSDDLNKALLDNFDAHMETAALFAFAADGNAPSTQAGAEDAALKNTVSTTIVHNATYAAAFPTALTALLDANAKALYGAQASVTMSTHPLPISAAMEEYLDSIGILISSVVILLPFTLLPSSYIGHVVRERQCKAKMLQLISGVRLSMYWLASFTFDIATYGVTMTLIMLTFWAGGRDEFIGDSGKVAATGAVLAMYGLASILFSYAASFLFGKAIQAQVAWCGLNFLTGFGLVMQTYILEFISGRTPAGAALTDVYRVLSPAYCVGHAIMTLASAQAKAVAEKRSRSPTGVWEWAGVKGDVLVMFGMVPVYLFAIYLAEHVPRWRARRKQQQAARASSQRAPQASRGYEEMVPLAGDEREGAIAAPLLFAQGDEAPPVAPKVVEARGKILANTDAENDAAYCVVVKALRKEFPAAGGHGMKAAVDGITFGVPKRGLFAFLGTNGAGKTTTMSIMTGDQPPTEGTVTVEGFDVVENVAEVRKRLGFCPQFDALLDQLSVEEHFTLYAHLRGLPRHVVSETVSMLIDTFGLGAYRTQPTKSLSGGTRRKVSVAISLIGGPRVVVLDEPSAGMDPVARRALWLVLQKVCEERAVVLTTHHLEEVEGLSDAHPTVCVMVAAQIRCLDSLQGLKDDYGDSYKLELRARDAGAELEIQAFVAELCPAGVLVEHANRRLTYRVPRSMPIGEYFARIEAKRREAGILDYTVTETSLEQVFMKISNEAAFGGEPLPSKRPVCT